tara:strand:+ start:963 stop:1460 length:498 start_codon:yes stop_codon:yes gene_type:complete
MELDHVCYRCETVAEYKKIIRSLTDAKIGNIIVEGMIGRRPIATLRFYNPIETLSGYIVSCIEIPCPKKGRYYASGFEHLEFSLLGKSMFGNNELKRFMKKHPSLTFILREFNKNTNPAVSVKIFLNGRYYTVKFHIRPLYEVIEYEIANNEVVPVPDNWFETHY